MIFQMLIMIKTGGGIAYLLNDLVSIDCSLGYSYLNNSVKSVSPGTSDFDHSVIQQGFTSEIGINFYLR